MGNGSLGRDLVERGPDAGRGSDSVDEAHAGHDRGLDAGGEVDRVEVEGGLHDVGVVGGPVGVAGFASVQVAVGVGPGGDADQDGGDRLGAQAGEGEALLAAHAAAGEDDGLAVPVGAGQEVVEDAGVAEIHVEEVGLLAVGVADGLVGERDAAGGVVGLLVVGVDVEDQPSGGGALRIRVSVEGIDAGILQLDQGRELAVLGGLGDVSVGLGAEGVQGEDAQLDAGHIALGGGKDGIDGNLGLLGQLSVPEGVEIGRPRRVHGDLEGSDGGADGIETVVAAGVASHICSGRGYLIAAFWPVTQ